MHIHMCFNKKNRLLLKYRSGSYVSSKLLSVCCLAGLCVCQRRITVTRDFAAGSSHLSREILAGSGSFRGTQLDNTASHTAAALTTHHGGRRQPLRVTKNRPVGIGPRLEGGRSVGRITQISLSLFLLEIRPLSKIPVYVGIAS